MDKLITEILKGLDYGIDVTLKVKILIDKYLALQEDYLALGKKHLELEQKYKVLYDRSKKQVS